VKMVRKLHRRMSGSRVVRLEKPCCSAEAQLTHPDKTWRQNLTKVWQQNPATVVGDKTWGHNLED